VNCPDCERMLVKRLKAELEQVRKEREWGCVLWDWLREMLPDAGCCVEFDTEDLMRLAEKHGRARKVKSPSKYNYCGKKGRHASESSALGSGKFANMNAYRCPKCRCWHLTRDRQNPIDEATAALFTQNDKLSGGGAADSQQQTERTPRRPLK
jgi:hypothetical protein